MPTMGYLPDSGYDPAQILTTASVNGVIRSQWIEDSRQVQLVGKFYTDIYTCNRPILNGVSLDVTLFRTRPEFTLLTKNVFADKKYQIKLLDCKLAVRRLKLTMEWKSTLEAHLKHEPAKYPFISTDCSNFNIWEGAGISQVS